MFLGYIAVYAADHQYELGAHYTAPGIHYINVSAVKGSMQLTEKMKPTPSTSINITTNKRFGLFH